MGRSRACDLDRVASEVREAKLAPDETAVRMWVRAHATVTGRRRFGNLFCEASGFVEQLLRTIAAHPLLEQAQVFGILAHRCKGNLMSAPESFDFLAIDFLRPGPSFWTAQNDQRPLGRLGFVIIRAIVPRVLLNGPDMVA